MKWQQIKSADGMNRRPSKGWRASRGTPGNAMSRLYLFSFFNGSSFNNLFSNNYSVVGKGVNYFFNCSYSFNSYSVSSSFSFSSSFFVTTSEERHAEYYSKHKN